MCRHLCQLARLSIGHLPPGHTQHPCHMSEHNIDLLTGLSEYTVAPRSHLEARRLDKLQRNRMEERKESLWCLVQKLLLRPPGKEASRSVACLVQEVLAVEEKVALLWQTPRAKKPARHSQ